MEQKEQKKAGEKSPFRVTQGRSPAYPYISLDKALERIEQIRAAGATRQPLPPEAFFKIWGLGSQSSGSRQTLAALNHYGLVDYIGRGDDRKAKLSDLALSIVLDKEPNSAKRAAAIRSAAITPTIHAALYEKYGAFTPADVVLETYLVRDCDYNEQAAKALLETYKATLAFANLDKPDGAPQKTEISDNLYPTVKELSVGDLVQVELGGALQLETPAKIRAIKEHEGQKWVFVSGSNTGIPFDQVILVSKGRSDELPQKTAPTLVEEPANVSSLKAEAGEHEWLRGKLSKETSYRILVTGEIGPKEIGKLIKLLTTQKDILSDDDDDDKEPEMVSTI